MEHTWAAALAAGNTSRAAIVKEGLASGAAASARVAAGHTVLQDLDTIEVAKQSGLA